MKQITFFAIAYLLVSFLPAFAQGISLPLREGARPETTDGVPHLQIGLKERPELTEQLLKFVAKFPEVTIGPTRISLPGAFGFQLKANSKLAHPEAIVGGQEFAHVHPDGSLHASLDPTVAIMAVKNGWAVPHPWSSKRSGWEGFVMIYTPTDQKELEIVKLLVKNSYSYITGRSLN